MRPSRALPLAALALFAQQPGANYDEAKVPRYTLPSLLTLATGQPVRDAKTWTSRRRPELFRLLESQMFGRAPAPPARLDFTVAGIDRKALGGKAIRKQVTLTLNGHPVSVLLYIPAGASSPPPVFLGLNFTGNHTVNADPGILLPRVWTRDHHQLPAPESARGASASRWPVEMILARGFALATAYYEEIEPDFDGGIAHGIRAGLPQPAPGEWNAIAAWAWGLSRIVDYLETDHDVDPRRIALVGHSRLGKTALWAAAADTRFGLVVSNDSGEGGAALSRREFGEQVANLNRSFPHWFCANYKRYSGRESEMPFDSHMLLALIAPRPLYVASAQEDLWADPRGEFLAAVAAGPAWQLFGLKGIGTTEMPPVNHPVGDTVRYHVRTGKHDITAYDWEQYLSFAAAHLRPR